MFLLVYPKWPVIVVVVQVVLVAVLMTYADELKNNCGLDKSRVTSCQQ